MENYNLTAELKKIASGINTSDPNTELGNINSNVGNLESAMNGVATAINNKTIPDPTTALGNIATTIGTKAIPDPNANIQAVSNALVSISGGKSLYDIESILSSIRATLTQIGLNNVVNLTPTTGGFIMTFGGGGQTLVPNEAQFVDYTDTNNIGATDVQGAIDILDNYGHGIITLNSDYVRGGALYYQKFGKVVTVYGDGIKFSSLPSSSGNVVFASGLPVSQTLDGIMTILLFPVNGGNVRPIRVAFYSNDTKLYFHWTITSTSSDESYNIIFAYICK